MDKPRTTPKDFFMWAGAMVALYWSTIAFIFLIFDYINYAFPDPLRFYPADPYQSGISFEMASLVVLFPIFAVVMWLIHRDINRDRSRAEVWVRRWALILTLFLAALSMTIDLVYLLQAFFNGEAITTAFLLKVVIIFLVAAAAFMHFIADYWGYWQQYPERARSVGYITGFLVVATIVAGFFIIGTPAHARLMRYDTQKISDLQQLQSQIVYYWQQKQKLPAALSDLNDSLSSYSIPNDPQSGKPYTYQINGTRTFSLCATFNTDSGGLNNAPAYASASAPVMPAPAGKIINDNWQHGSGQACFMRTIDPQLYPSAKTQ